MKAIIALDKNYGIGLNNGLPWPKISEDFKWFKEFTTNKICVVGKNTFLGMPPLKNRRMIVLSSSNIGENFWNPLWDRSVYYASLDTISEINEKQELICIGGAKTYLTLAPLITDWHVTHVNGEFESDTFMRNLS